MRCSLYRDTFVDARCTFRCFDAFTYNVYARDNDMVQKHVQAHKDAWQAYKKTYREYGYSNSNDMIGAVEEEMLKTQETKVEEALRRGEEGIAVVDEEATVIMHNETITPTSPPHHSLIMNQSANLLKALVIVSKSMI